MGNQERIVVYIVLAFPRHAEVQVELPGIQDHNGLACMHFVNLVLCEGLFCLPHDVETRAVYTI